jgi:hypothetical protein
VGCNNRFSNAADLHRLRCGEDESLPLATKAAINFTIDVRAEESV